MTALEPLHGELGFDHAVLVQPTVYGPDHRLLVDVLKGAPPGRYVGVAIVNDAISDRELMWMHEAGIRGDRFDFGRKFKLAPTVEEFRRTLERIRGLGWFVKIFGYGEDFMAVADELMTVECMAVIDHIGGPEIEGGVASPGFQFLLDLLKRPNWWGMLSNGDTRSKTGAPWTDVKPFGKAFYEAAPDRCMWGSDWPHVHRFVTPRAITCTITASTTSMSNWACCGDIVPTKNPSRRFWWTTSRAFSKLFDQSFWVGGSRRSRPHEQAGSARAGGGLMDSRSIKRRRGESSEHAQRHRRLESLYGDLGAGSAVYRGRTDLFAPTIADIGGEHPAAHQFKTLDGAIPRRGVASIRVTSDIVAFPLVDGKRRRIKAPVAEGKSYVGLVFLFSSATGELIGILQDGLLQRFTVGAINAIGAKHLSRSNARRVGLIGAGNQAGPQLEALKEVRDIQSVCVYSPDGSEAQAFADRMSAQLGLRMTIAASAKEAVDGVDIAVTAHRQP